MTRDSPIALTRARRHARMADLNEALRPHLDRLLAHPVYDAVDSLPRLRAFMSLHVWAVWDFMSLVKRLQAEVCGTRLPWVPPRDPVAARFMGEIVLAEEADLGPDGQPVAHLQAYLRAMEEVGASSPAFRDAQAALVSGAPWRAVLGRPGVPAVARRFCTETLRVAEDGQPEEAAAAFLFGREEVIPPMFARLLAGGAQGWAAPDRTRWMRWYLERHIEVDGDEHGPMAAALLERLCGDRPDAWARAEAAAIAAVQGRIALWDVVLDSLPPR